MIEIKNKTVAIVGNAKSIFKTRYGDEIDKHDIVVRFNKGNITRSEAQGTKTDILFLAEPFGKEHIKHFKPKLVLNRRQSFVHQNGGKTIDRSHLLDRWFKHLNAPPSSGFAMVHYMLENNPKLPIDIYGFDWGRTKTFYNPDYYKTHHNYSPEEKIIKSLGEKVRINV